MYESLVEAAWMAAQSFSWLPQRQLALTALGKALSLPILSLESSPSSHPTVVLCREKNVWMVATITYYIELMCLNHFDCADKGMPTRNQVFKVMFCCLQHPFLHLVGWSMPGMNLEYIRNIYDMRKSKTFSHKLIKPFINILQGHLVCLRDTWN